MNNDDDGDGDDSCGGSGASDVCHKSWDGEDNGKNDSDDDAKGHARVSAHS